MRFVSKVPVFVLLLLLTLGTVHSYGQVTAAARGGGNQANAFGMFTFNEPDYGTSWTYGITAGADYRFGNWSLGQPAIAARLSREIAAVLDTPEGKDALSRQGVDAEASTPEGLEVRISSEIAKWREVVAKTGIRVE